MQPLPSGAFSRAFFSGAGPAATAGAYQTLQGFGFTIGAVFLQLKLLAKLRQIGEHCVGSLLVWRVWIGLRLCPQLLGASSALQPLLRIGNPESLIGRVAVGRRTHVNVRGLRLYRATPARPARARPDRRDFRPSVSFAVQVNARHSLDGVILLDHAIGAFRELVSSSFVHQFLRVARLCRTCRPSSSKGRASTHGRTVETHVARSFAAVVFLATIERRLENTRRGKVSRCSSADRSRR